LARFAKEHTPEGVRLRRGWRRIGVLPVESFKPLPLDIPARLPCEDGYARLHAKQNDQDEQR
jgi:hypothetical protein